MYISLPELFAICYTALRTCFIAYAFAIALPLYIFRALRYPTLRYPTLPYLFLPYPTLPFRTLGLPFVPFSTLPLPYLTLPLFTFF